MTPRELGSLIDSLLEGEISEADFLRLEAELSSDPAARREYYQRVGLSMLLEAELKAQEGAMGKGRATGPRPISARRWRGAFVGMAIAAAALLAAVVWLIDPPEGAMRKFTPGRPIAGGSTEEQAAGFAVVTGQAGATWQDGRSMPDGSLVSPGPLLLKSGVVQLELFSGVTLVVEGEAEFSILSPMEVSVAGGKVRAMVPEPAHGFRIRTGEGEIVDLGTDFAVKVAAGSSEVHVLEGEVEWHPRADRMRRMETGQAMRRTAEGAQTEMAANRAGFVGGDELRERLSWARDVRRERWKLFSENLRNDPRLVALYQMDAEASGSRRLANRAVGGAMTAGDGAVVGAIRTIGRWGRSDGALDFSPAGSRVRLSIPGEHRSLTMLCWVRINSLDRWYNSLFLTDGHDEREPHWQIKDDGRLFFSVKKRDRFDAARGEKDKHIYLSPPFWNNSMSGQWLMLATVYDVDSRRVTHYLNGGQLSQEAIPEEYLVERVRIGNASLCNWGLPERNDPRFAVRNLNGAMDEFALFSAALSADQIMELYENGKP